MALPRRGERVALPGVEGADVRLVDLDARPLQVVAESEARLVDEPVHSSRCEEAPFTSVSGRPVLLTSQ